MLDYLKVRQHNNLQSLYTLVEDEFRKAVIGNSNQFLYNLDYYLVQDKEVVRALKKRGVYALESMGATVSEETMQDDIYLATLGLLEKDLCIFVDMHSSTYSSFLGTRSLSLLNSLSFQGVLHNYAERFKQLEGFLTGERLQKSLDKREFNIVQVKVDKFVQGNPILSATTGRCIKVGGGERFVAIPLSFIGIAINALRDIGKSEPLELVHYSRGQMKTSKVATNLQVVTEVYKGLQEHELQSLLRRVNIDFDISTLSFKVFNLETSIHESNAENVRLELLDEVSMIPVPAIKTYKHTVNYSNLRAIYKSKVKTMKKDELDVLPFVDTSELGTVKEKVDFALEYGDKLSDADMFNLMIRNQEIFGDLQDSLDKKDKLTPKYLKEFDFVALPDISLDRADILRQMLEEGVVRLTYRKAGGITETIAVSNNEKALERVLGKTYKETYESLKVRLNIVKEEIEKKKTVTEMYLERTASRYGVLSSLDKRKYLSGSDGALEALEKALKAVPSEVEATILSNKNMVTYKKVYADSPQDFNGWVDVSNIISCEVSKV